MKAASNTEQLKRDFISEVEQCSALVNKVSLLYTDTVFDREDLKQEILFQAWKSFPNFRRESKFSTWIYRVALNTSISHLRKQKKSITFSLNEDQNQHGETDNRFEQRDQLLFAIKQLSKIDRAIISLHLDGYSNKEIGETLGVNYNNITVKIHRIKSSLKEKLNK